MIDDIIDVIGLVYWLVLNRSMHIIDRLIDQEDLILSLRGGLTDPSLAEYNISLFMEKLDSDLESAKVLVASIGKKSGAFP